MFLVICSELLLQLLKKKMIDVVKHQFKLMFLALPFLIVYLFDEIRSNICFILILVSLIIVYERFNEFVVHQYINTVSCSLSIIKIKKCTSFFLQAFH